MLGDVHCGTVKRFENPTFKNRNTHAANVPHLPVWSNNPLRHVTSTALPMHHPDGFSHGSSVIRVDCGQLLLKVRGIELQRLGVTLWTVRTSPLGRTIRNSASGRTPSTRFSSTPR